MMICVGRVATEVPEGHPGGDIWEPLGNADLDSGERDLGVINLQMAQDEVTQGRCGDRKRGEN